MEHNKKEPKPTNLSTFLALLEIIPLAEREALSDTLDSDQLPLQERDLFDDWEGREQVSRFSQRGF